jgi:hypothetical protein
MMKETREIRIMKTMKTILVAIGTGLATLLCTTGCISVHEHHPDREVIVRPAPAPVVVHPEPVIVEPRHY